jgi:DNA polymerase-3 subunit gamma/tau
MSYEPLFLKYRPQTLADVLGQDSVKATLLNAIQNNKIVHAYLLTGPRGSGKTSTARIIAKSLNCSDAADGKSPTTQPCGTCDSCVSITNSSSIDVTEIDAASHGGVEDARQLIERVNLASVAGKYRVYIIDEVHMLSTSAFNALLKTIEEPPTGVIFILATTEVDKVPKTIASRCQQLKFKSISLNDALTRLRYVADKEQIKIDEAALRLIAEHSDGAMRDALSLFDQLSVFSDDSSSIDEQRVLEILGVIPSDELKQLSRSILLRDTGTLCNKLDELVERGKEPSRIASELADYLLALLERLASKAPDTKFQELIDLCKEANIENFELVQIIDSLSELEFRFNRNKLSRNILKAWFVKMTHRAEILVVKDLLLRIEKLENGERSTVNGQRQPVNNERPVVNNQSFKPKSESSTFNVQSSAFSSSTQINVAELPLTVDRSPLTSSSNDFLGYLSPGSKGMLVSSQAQLIEIHDGVALMKMPDNFKFLKSRLEAKSDELIIAIQKSSGKEIKSLSIEVVTADEIFAVSPRQSN